MVALKEFPHGCGMKDSNLLTMSTLCLPQIENSDLFPCLTSWSIKALPLIVPICHYLMHTGLSETPQLYEMQNSCKKSAKSTYIQRKTTKLLGQSIGRPHTIWLPSGF